MTELKRYGIMLSETGDILVSEVVLMDLMEEVGLDIYRGGTVDSIRVGLVASSHGIDNLGGFGALTDSDVSNFLYHMPSYRLDEYEQSLSEGGKNNLLLDSLLDRAVEIMRK